MWYMYSPARDAELKRKYNALKTAGKEDEMRTLRNAILTDVKCQLSPLKHEYYTKRTLRRQQINSGVGNIADILYNTETLNYLHAQIGHYISFAHTFDIQMK